jgi:hypothetical protein
MIMANEEKEPEPQMEFPDELIKCFWLLLNTVGGSITVSRAHIKSLPNEAVTKMLDSVKYNKAVDGFDFKIPKKKRKRGIIKLGDQLVKPNREIIIP